MQVVEADDTMALQLGAASTRGRIVLIPIAIAINIVLGQTVASVLKVPIYLDSIGTVLVGVLAGPIPGLVTGVLTNLIWTYVLPPRSIRDFAAPFAVVAAVDRLLRRVVAAVGLPSAAGRTPWGKIARRRPAHRRRPWRRSATTASCRSTRTGRSRSSGHDRGRAVLHRPRLRHRRSRSSPRSSA